MKEYLEESMDYNNEKWECYLCTKEDDWEYLPSGYINNMHPLCEKCADKVLIDSKHRQHRRLSYHKDTGDILNI